MQLLERMVLGKINSFIKFISSEKGGMLSENSFWL